MKNMIPSKYPPETPLLIATNLKSNLEEVKAQNGILIGSGVPEIIKRELRSRKNTLNISAENENLGFSFLDTGNNTCSVVFENTNDDPEMIIESNAITLHAFKYLGIERIIILDMVSMFEKSDKAFFRIDDHINLTSINPLEFWMMFDEPDSFFLDVKNMYSKDGLDSLPGLIHAATVDGVDNKLLDQARLSGADSFGNVFLPEAILAGYLGMKVSCIAVNSNNIILKDTSDCALLLNLIKSL
jgi:purine nucleoside phosphorylase